MRLRLLRVIAHPAEFPVIEAGLFESANLPNFHIHNRPALCRIMRLIIRMAHLFPLMRVDGNENERGANLRHIERD